MSPRFSNTDALRFGWNTTRTHLAPLLIIGAAGGMLGLISQALGRGGAGGALIGGVVQIFQVVLTLLLMRVAMRLFDGEPVDLAQPGPLLSGFWSFLLAVFLLGLLVSVGLALLVVPGVLLGLAFGFAPFFTAEGQKDVVEAFRASSRLTRNYRVQLFGLAMMLLGVNLLGLLALGIGVVVTVPISMLAIVYAFRRLEGRTEAVTPPVSNLHPRAV